MPCAAFLLTSGLGTMHSCVCCSLKSTVYSGVPVLPEALVADQGPTQHSTVFSP